MARQNVNKCADFILLELAFKVLEDSGQTHMAGVLGRFREMASQLQEHKSFHKDLNWGGLDLPGIKTYENTIRALIPMLKKAKANGKVSEDDTENLKSCVANSIAIAKRHLDLIRRENAPGKHVEAIERRIKSLQDIEDIFKD